MDRVLADAQSLYKRGGPKVYSGDRVANFNGDQTTSFGLQRGIADQLGAQAANPGIGALTGMINDGGLTSRQDQTLQSMMPLATSADPLNPYLRSMIDDQANKMTDRLNRQFAGAGRLGSYSNASGVGDAVGDFTRGAMFQGYESGMNQKMAAADAVMRGDQAGQSNVMSASQMLPNLQAADANAKLMGANLYGGIGQQQQAQAQREKDAQMAAFNEQQQRPYQNLQWYSGMVNPIASAFGSNTSSGSSEGTSTTETKTPAWQTALGLGMAGASLFSGMPMGGSNPMAGMFGGGGMFGSSAPQAPPSYAPQMSYMTPSYNPSQFMSPNPSPYGYAY